MTAIPWIELLAVGMSPLAWLWQVFHSAGDARLLWAQDVMAAALAVLVALLLDRLWGEPPVWLHPVVAMGKLLGLLGKWIAPHAEIYKAWPRFVAGMLAWCATAASVFIAYAALQFLLPPQPWWLTGVLAGVLLKPLLAWRMLKDEVLAVDFALQQSLGAGRERLTWLVSRDTTQLDAATVRESAIETLAENLNDSVIAPLFWFAVAGLPGAALYRLANTADAMWGYPGWRGQGAGRRHWQWAGKWAARADDVLNWIPARITALWLVVVAGGVDWRGLRSDAVVTPSPNGGWAMGAMARALGVRLSKPGVYQLNPQGEAAQTQHLRRAIDLASKVVFTQVVLSLAAMVLMAAVIWRLPHG